MKTILITGGAGFIGSAVVRKLLSSTPYVVINVDALTYAGNLDSLSAVGDNARHIFKKVDICDAESLRELFRTYSPSGVLHLAAESHVDRSIDGPAAFVQTNVVGSFTLLQEALTYWRMMPADKKAQFRFLHVSTDEVYGTLGPTGLFTEESPYQPNSPYSASKAASDHFARAWYHTYGLPVVTTNCSNNYGPYQFPEKLIPLTILRALKEQPLPVYGRGENVRDWLYVDDHADALLTVLENGEVGETYNIGAHEQRTNIDVVLQICRELDDLAPSSRGTPRSSLITYVVDRPGHDMRYAIDARKIRERLGWSATESFETGLRKTIRWYLDNPAWCDRVQSGAYRLERLGMSSEAAQA